MHVNAPEASHSRRRLAAALLILVIFPAAVAGYYFGYNVGVVSLYVTDDAIDDFSHLYITFSQVQVRSAGALTGAAWNTIAITTATIDLVELRDNVTALVAQAKLHAGGYSQIRLVVDNATGDLVGGGTAVVDVPSGELKTDSPFTVTAQGETDLALRLLIVAAGPRYELRPVFAGAAAA